jgi:hypothetical protein
MPPTVRQPGRVPLLPPPREYVIPLADGTSLRVTGRELGMLREEYQNAAQVAPPTQPTYAAYAMPIGRSYTRETGRLPARSRYRFPRFHPLFWVGIALALVITAWMTYPSLATWFNTTQDDWHYGRPRTFQTDAFVGHGTTKNPNSHFIAQNLGGRVLVIELPADDPSSARIYIGPTLVGPDRDLAPVTLTFEDVNADGQPDLIIHVGDQKAVLLNQKDGTFKAPKH